MATSPKSTDICIRCGATRKEERHQRAGCGARERTYKRHIWERAEHTWNRGEEAEEEHGG